MSEKLTLPLKEVDGEMYLPAAVVSTLLRAFGTQWQLWTATGQVDLDPETVDSLAYALEHFADQLDVDAQPLAVLNHGVLEAGPLGHRLG